MKESARSYALRRKGKSPNRFTKKNSIFSIMIIIIIELLKSLTKSTKTVKKIKNLLLRQQ